MERIEIFEDHRGILCLRQYNGDGKIEFNLRDDDVYRYLSKISTYGIRHINTNTKEGKIHSISAITSNYKIDLLELDKLQKYEKRISPITEKIEKFIDDNNIKAYKEQSSSNRPPRVNRENKYSKFKIGGAIFFTGLLVTSNFLGYSLLKDKINIKYSDDSVPEIKIERPEQPKVQEVPYIIPEQESILSIPAVEEKTPIVEEEVEDNTICVSIECEDLCNNEKNIYVKENYGSIIEKYATRYGVDPNIMIAIATQERGVHSSVKDKGGATGLMQMQNGVWVGNEISAYNYETGKKDTFKVTKENIGRLEENIMFGCMYFQNCMDCMGHNPIPAVQGYNMGITAVKKILKAYANAQGTTTTSVLADPTDLGWMDYRHLIPNGDQKYVENVFRYLDVSAKTIVSNRDNTSYGIQITKNAPIKTM